LSDFEIDRLQEIRWEPQNKEDKVDIPLPQRKFQKSEFETTPIVFTTIYNKNKSGVIVKTDLTLTCLVEWKRKNRKLYSDE